MDNLNLTSYTASEARTKLYQLVRSASRGLKSYEIKLQGSQPVILISKADLESWLETLDVLSNKTEMRSLHRALRQKDTVSLKQAQKQLQLSDEN